MYKRNVKKFMGNKIDYRTRYRGAYYMEDKTAHTVLYL